MSTALAQALVELRSLAAADVVVEPALAPPARQLQLRLAQTSLAVGELFDEWSQRDFADANNALDDVTRALLSMPRSQAASYTGGWKDWQEALPTRQAEDALAATKEAIVAARSAGLLSPPPALASPHRAADDSTDAEWSLVGARMGEDGYWRSSASGRVIFGHSYNKLLNIFNGTELIFDGVSSDGGLGVGTDAADVATAAVDALAATHASRLRQLTRGLGANLATCELAHSSPNTHF